MHIRLEDIVFNELRFWKYVDKTPGHGPNGDCWLWVGGTYGHSVVDDEGYGGFNWKSSTTGLFRTIAAHRAMWIITRRKLLPSSKDYICHKCDYVRCVKPTHLFKGTPKMNSRDKVAKHRHSSGIGNTRISDAEVVLIRKLYARGGVSQQKLADRFGVSQVRVSQLILCKGRV